MTADALRQEKALAMLEREEAKDRLHRLQNDWIDVSAKTWDRLKEFSRLLRDGMGQPTRLQLSHYDDIVKVDDLILLVDRIASAESALASAESRLSVFR